MLATRNIAFAIVCGLLCQQTYAVDNDNGKEKKLGKLDPARATQFWKVLASGEADALGGYYATEVTLKAGSELLKPKWQLKNADRSKDLTVSRDELLAGYKRLIKEVGQQRWANVMGAIKDDKIKSTLAAQDDKPFAGVKQGDIVLQVSPGNDSLYFVFRQDKHGKLVVHLEATDY